MKYDDYIEAIKCRLEERIAFPADHALDEKYIASSIRDYCEAIRALEQAKSIIRREY